MRNLKKYNKEGVTRNKNNYVIRDRIQNFKHNQGELERYKTAELLHYPRFTREAPERKDEWKNILLKLQF